MFIFAVVSRDSWCTATVSRETDFKLSRHLIWQVIAYGRGMTIATSFNCKRSSWSSHSMLTSHAPRPLSSAQQFTRESNIWRRCWREKNQRLTEKWNETFILSLETPFQHTHITVERKRFSGVLKCNLLCSSEQLFIDIWMGLDLHTTVVILQLGVSL